jgi:pentatricopeptide repeat protein
MDPLNFEAIVKWNDEIAYAASYNYNALFKVFLSNGDTSKCFQMKNQMAKDYLQLRLDTMKKYILSRQLQSILQYMSPIKTIYIICR